jgi:hypothetical protein
MAQVFISHAHKDEELARKVSAVLCDALALEPTDFFLSSQEGRGVAPSGSIRSEIMKEVSTVSALVVLLTPNSAGSPWVWLEAGSRFGSADKTRPIFVVPSAESVALLQPVSDLRGLQLSNDGEVHELVGAVAKDLGRQPRDYLVYKPAVDDLTASVRAYRARAQRHRAMAWLTRHGGGFLLGFVLAIATYRLDLVPFGASDHAAPADQLNTVVVNAVAPYLKLKGKVTSADGDVSGATVMVARSTVKDPAACSQMSAQAGCVQDVTTADGQYTLDLTKIQARHGEEVVLNIVKDGFVFFDKKVTVDVRAMDITAVPQTYTLRKRPGAQ